MNGDELADSGEDFVVTAAGLLLGWWVGVASRPRESKTADMPSPNSRGELGAGGWGVRQTPFSPGRGRGEGQRMVAKSAASSAESGVVPSTLIIMLLLAQQAKDKNHFLVHVALGPITWRKE